MDSVTEIRQNQRVIKVILACAIEVEWQAINAALGPMRTLPTRQGVFHIVQKSLGGYDFEIIVVQTGPGNIKAQITTSQAMHVHTVDAAVFVGVAGGIKDVELGDVVVSTKVSYYETTKETDDGTLPRPTSWPIRHPLIQLAQLAAHKGREECGYATVTGTIASGEKVIASSHSTSADLIKKSYSDSLAIEMEAGGFVHAAQSYDVGDFIVIRGISDLLDNKSSSDGEGWQEKAAKNAVEVALNFLSTYAESVAGNPTSSGRATSSLPATSTSADFDVPLPSSSQCYALISPPESKISSLLLDAGFPFNLVMDLDPDTDTRGLLSSVADALNKERFVQLFAPQDEINATSSTLIWLATRGLEGRGGVRHDYKPWLQHLRSAIAKSLSSISRIFDGRQCTILVPTDGKTEGRWMQLMVEELLTAFSIHCQVVTIGSAQDPLLADISDRHISLAANDVTQAVTGWLAPLTETPTDTMSVPSASGVLSIEPRDRLWLAEDLDLVWIGAGAGRQNAEAESLAFWQGGEATWTALNSDCDVRRPAMEHLSEQVSKEHEVHRVDRVNIFHEPGSGGTTVGRRLLFDFHSKNPCVLIRGIRTSETASRLQWISQQSGLRVIAVIDSPAISERQVSLIIDELKALLATVTVVHVSRRHNKPSGASNSVFIESKLDDIEAGEFFDRYKSLSPASLPELEAVYKVRDERRTPFFFGLAAFEEDFHGLSSYVEQRLHNAPEPQISLLKFCCLAYAYGHATIPERYLAPLAGLSRSNPEILGHVLSPGIRSLLWRTEEGEWRAVHHLVAREVLQQLANSTLWQRQLSLWGKEFIDFMKDQAVDFSPEIDSVLTNIFIKRDSDDLIGSDETGTNKFSHFIEDIPSKEGAADMLAYLSETFPDQPHYAAHVARFYAFSLRNYERATEYAETASSLAPGSPLIRHVLGMVHRARAYDEIGKREPVESVIIPAKKAAEEFAQSRRIATIANEHAFISDAQMRIKLVAYASRQHSDLASYLRGAPHPFIIESLSKAEDLLSRVRSSNDARKGSGYEVRTRADLRALYGDFEKAFSALDILLQRDDTDPIPIRRQIVWMHFARRKSWREVPKSSVKRAVLLLEQNLRDGNYAASDIRQWWNVARYLQPTPSHDRVLELMAYWRTSEYSVDSLYHSYVALAVDVMDGIRSSIPQMNQYIKDCSSAAQKLGGRVRSHEWVGDGVGIARLVQQSELGNWDQGHDFWSDTSRLVRLEGIISEIRDPRAGTVTVLGIPAFFAPGRSGFIKGRDHNQRVSGYLGFSYDGPRFWDVKRLD